MSIDYAPETVPVSGLVVIPRALLDGAMAARGLTVERLAEEAGVAPNTIHAARRGHPVQARTLVKLDHALGRIEVLKGPLGVALAGPE